MRPKVESAIKDTQNTVKHKANLHNHCCGDVGNRLRSVVRVRVRVRGGLSLLVLFGPEAANDLNGLGDLGREMARHPMEFPQPDLRHPREELSERHEIVVVVHRAAAAAAAVVPAAVAAGRRLIHLNEDEDLLGLAHGHDTSVPDHRAELGQGHGL